MLNQLKESNKPSKTDKDINHSLLQLNIPLFVNKNKKFNLIGFSNKNEIQLYEKFINLLMIHGKKIKAYNILYDTLKFLEAKNLSLAKLNQVESVLLDSPRNRKISFLNAGPYPLVQPKDSSFSFANVAAATSNQAFLSNGKNQKINDNQFFKDPLLTFNFLFKAIKNVKPSVEVRKVRKGGRIYQVPALIPKRRQEALAIRWIIDAAKIRKKNSKTSFAECLAIEFIEASKNQGKPKQKRDELHKLAELNRAYIRFRWW